MCRHYMTVPQRALTRHLAQIVQARTVMHAFLAQDMLMMEAETHVYVMQVSATLQYLAVVLVSVIEQAISRQPSHRRLDAHAQLPTTTSIQAALQTARY